MWRVFSSTSLARKVLDKVAVKPLRQALSSVLAAPREEELFGSIFHISAKVHRITIELGLD